MNRARDQMIVIFLIRSQRCARIRRRLARITEVAAAEWKLNNPAGFDGSFGCLLLSVDALEDLEFPSHSLSAILAALAAEQVRFAICGEEGRLEYVEHRLHQEKTQER